MRRAPMPRGWLPSGARACTVPVVLKHRAPRMMHKGPPASREEPQESRPGLAEMLMVRQLHLWGRPPPPRGRAGGGCGSEGCRLAPAPPRLCIPFHSEGFYHPLNFGWGGLVCSFFWVGAPCFGALGPGPGAARGRLSRGGGGRKRKTKGGGGGGPRGGVVGVCG